mmetsp:Transcript_36953/g.78829  ORF Transcript_36953/g.78829 Transcript_36953/m.78829 type:complete len:215 (+) Transcript_36953:1596-2240(+)
MEPPSRPTPELYDTVSSCSLFTSSSLPSFVPSSRVAGSLKRISNRIGRYSRCSLVSGVVSMPTPANTNALSICVKSAWKGTVVNCASPFNFATMDSASSVLTSRTLSCTIASSNEAFDEGYNLAVKRGMDGTFSRSGTGRLVRISSEMGCSFSAIASSNVLARRFSPSSPRSLACCASRSFSPSEMSFDIAALGFPRTTAMGLSRMYSFMSPCQ